MSISYIGHCALPVAAAQPRIVVARALRPAWFGTILGLSDAMPPSTPFGREISREFGIEAASVFSLDVLDKFRIEEVGTGLRDAVDLLYRVFGTVDLVMTFELDMIVPPRAAYPPMRIA